MIGAPSSFPTIGILIKTGSLQVGCLELREGSKLSASPPVDVDVGMDVDVDVDVVATAICLL